MEKKRIYCSGPLFCAEEIGGMSAIAGVLEDAGFQTFLPHRDGLEHYVVRFGKMPVPSDNRWSAEGTIFLHGGNR